MSNSPIDRAFAMPKHADFAPYVVPPRLVKWAPFIRAARFQRYTFARIAATLQAQGVTASADDVEALVRHYHRQRSNPPIKAQLDSAAADIDALRERGVSEHQVCFWLAINRGLAVHQCQINEWARIRRNQVK